MKLISWNVNGLRAVLKKNFMEVFEALDADIFCLQETKLQEGQADLELPGYEQYWNYAEKKGYSGTALRDRHRGARPRGKGHYAGIRGFLFYHGLYTELPERAGEAGLPDDLGGRFPCVSGEPPRDEAGGFLRGSERRA